MKNGAGRICQRCSSLAASATRKTTAPGLMRMDAEAYRGASLASLEFARVLLQNDICNPILVVRPSRMVAG